MVYQVNLVFLVFSVIASIYAAEFLVELSLVAEHLGIHVDTRDKYQFIADLRSSGIDAAPAVFPAVVLRDSGEFAVKSAITINGTEVLPLGGIAKIATVLCNESGEYLVYTSDEHGFHNPEGTWASRSSDVIAVGDSFTIGACVPSDKGFVALIRKHYPATLNLGINGAGPLVQLALLKEYLPFFEPRDILWFYFEGNDLSDLRREKKSTLLMRYLKDAFNQGLLTHQSEIDQALLNYTNTQEANRKSKLRKESSDCSGYLAAHMKLCALRRRLSLNYGLSRYTPPQFVESDGILFRQILENARAFVRMSGGRLIFVYLPDWHRYGNWRFVDTSREKVLGIVKSLGIPTIDIHSAFEAHGDPLSLFPHRQLGHYNEEGHYVVAESLLNFLPRYQPIW